MAGTDPLRFRLKVFLVIFFGVMALGIFGFMAVEHMSLADAFYFSVVTIATVGYGDIHPATPPGKMLAILLIVFGVGTFLGVIANATEIMLNRREKQARLKKVNMVIGVFFSEVGRKLLTVFSDHDPHLEGIRKELVVTSGWTDQDFKRADKALRHYQYGIQIEKLDLEALRGFLQAKRDLLVGLMGNPALLERESLTELLHAVFHLAEELSYREDFHASPETDKTHLAGDTKRVYVLLVHQWLDYMEHLKDNYPYLFSLAMRTNPFDEKASPIVQ